MSIWFVTFAFALFASIINYPRMLVAAKHFSQKKKMQIFLSLVAFVSWVWVLTVGLAALAKMNILLAAFVWFILVETADSK